ncbi:MAG: hypothetical protein IJ011_01375 [Clostridia bacterium]|nr:hypothetical protein [Clostridia bacterium]
MAKLLRAGFRRYLKSIVTWITLFMFIVLGCLGAAEIGPQSSSDDIYLISLTIGFSAMVTLSIGKEIGNGAVRNKIVKGYTKGQVFWSEIILSISLCFVFFIISAAPFILLNLPILKTIPTGVLIKTVIGIIFMSLGIVTISVAVSSLISNRAISAVAAMLLTIGILFSGYYLYDKLDQPEYWEAHYADGTIVENAQKNPNYVGGTQRAIYQFLYNANPMGQMIEYSEILSPYFTPYSVKLETPKEEMDFINSAPIYSVGTMIIVSGCGYILFRRKNIK